MHLSLSLSLCFITQQTCIFSPSTSRNNNKPAVLSLSFSFTKQQTYSFLSLSLSSSLNNNKPAVLWYLSPSSSANRHSADPPPASSSLPQCPVIGPRSCPHVWWGWRLCLPRSCHPPVSLVFAPVETPCIQKYRWIGHLTLCVGSVITDECFKPELSRTPQTTVALTRLKPVWNDRNISLSSKTWLMCSLVTSIFLYACESWTLTEKLQRKIQATEMRCYRKILHISYQEQVTIEEVHAKTKQAIGPHKDLLTIVKRRKLQWYGHVSHSSGLAKTILQGTVKGGRRRGRQRKRCEDNICEWTGLEFDKSQRAVENRERWRKLVLKSSVVPKWPSWLRDRWW